MNSAECRLMNTVWAYFRDHAKTPEQKALMDSIGRALKQDIQRRKKRRKDD